MPTLRRWVDRTFRSLRVPNYRRYFFGSAVSVTGTWMQRVGQDWLVLQLSHSGVALGIATGMQFLPVLVGSLSGGVVVDRVDRRRLLLVTQASSALLAGLLAVLTATGVVTLGHVYALAFALGVVTVFDTPGRQAFLTELVEGDDLINAQALYSTVHNAGRLIGPAVAGLLIARFGVESAFTVNCVSFLAVLLSLMRLDPAAMVTGLREPRRPGMVREGLRYVWARPELRATVAMVLVVGIFAQNFRVVLPLLATDTFHGDARAYGDLTAALGLGAVCGALASAARERSTTRALLGTLLGCAAANAALVAAPTFAVAMAGLVVLGFANVVLNTLARTILLAGSAPGLQGRVMALHSLVFLGSTPVGGPLLGAVCTEWGPRSGLAVGAASAVASAGLLVPVARRHRGDAAQAGRVVDRAQVGRQDVRP